MSAWSRSSRTRESSSAAPSSERSSIMSCGRTARPTRSTRCPERRAKRSPDFRCRATRPFSSRHFAGRGPVRSADILADPRYGKSEPYKGMPPGHLPVRSYLAVPVVSRAWRSARRFVLRTSPAGHVQRSCRTHSDGIGGAGGGRHRQFAPLSDQPARSRCAKGSRRTNEGAQQDTGATGRGARRAARREHERARGKRTAIPNSGRRCHRLRDLHARPDRHGDQLESGSGSASRAIRARRSSASTFRGSIPTRTGRGGFHKKRSATAARTGKYEAEGWRVRKDGTRFWASVVINAIRDGRGRPGGICQGHARPDGAARRRGAAASVAENGRHRPAHRWRCA